MTPYQLFLNSPEEALDRKFKKSFDNCPYYGERIFITVASEDAEGTTYSSFKYVKRNHLKNREYKIEFWDGSVSLLMTDVIFDPRAKTWTDKKTHQQYTELLRE